MIRTVTLDDCLHVVRHMRDLDALALQAALGDGISDEVFAIDRFRTLGPAWALLQDGAPVAIFGLSVHGWTATAWLLATDDISLNSWRKLTRHARIVRGNLLKQGVRRVEANVLGSWPAAKRLARHLGFLHEGTRRRAGSGGEDIELFGLVPRETP